MEKSKVMKRSTSEGHNPLWRVVGGNGVARITDADRSGRMVNERSKVMADG